MCVDAYNYNGQHYKQQHRWQYLRVLSKLVFSSIDTSFDSTFVDCICIWISTTTTTTTMMMIAAVFNSMKPDPVLNISMIQTKVTRRIKVRSKRNSQVSCKLSVPSPTVFRTSHLDTQETRYNGHKYKTNSISPPPPPPQFINLELREIH